MNKEDYNVEEALRSLSKKTNQETSQNGLVTIVYTGTGEIKDIKINAVLSDIDKAELEEEILNCINKTKEQLSMEIINMILEIDKKTSGGNKTKNLSKIYDKENDNSDQDDDGPYVEIKDVS